MSQGINWANPVFDVKTSQNYLARLQEFLATQQPGGSSADINSNKRKNPSTAGEVDTAPAHKDRKHASSRSIDQATHSHVKEGSSERESPEVDGSAAAKGRNAKNTTSDKRKEQNRNAQRAFRERKEKVVRDLEEKVSELERTHQNTVSENQNLKEMISRLQEENAKLRSTSAPQSDFTFTVPSAPAQTTAPAFSGSAITGNNDQSNSSLSSDGILSVLSSAPPPAQPSQMPFTMIHPAAADPSTTDPLTGAGLDDWMNNWNSSAFGTEMPQAVPPLVTNLAERPADSDFASLWNSLNQGSNSTFNTLQNQQAQQNAAESNNTLFSLFQTAFSPSLDGNTSPPNSSFSQYVNSSSTAPYNTTPSFASSMFPFESASGSTSSNPNDANGSSIGNTSSHHTQDQKSNPTRNRAPHSSSADSPETCASSTSGGSDPSVAQPRTPNNGQMLFGNSLNDKTKAKSGDSIQSFHPDFGLNSFNSGHMHGNGNTANNGSFNNSMLPSGLESATTPSAVFDTMNYRDPLLANLGGHSTSGGNFNFDSFISGYAPSVASPASGGNKRSDTLDFSDFLVASPPGMTQSPPVTGNLFQVPSNHAYGSNSSSSLPTLGSLSHGASPASTQPSPQTSLNTASSSTGPSSSNGTPNWLPYDVPYSHPLIQHVMRDKVQQDKANFESQMKAIPRSGPCDVDGLCDEMQMKASCKDHAMDRIAKSIQTDEMTMKLYNDYLATAGAVHNNNGSNGQPQQKPTPNLK